MGLSQDHPPPAEGRVPGEPGVGKDGVVRVAAPVIRVDIQAVEETPTRLCLVLPMQQTGSLRELSQQELEAVIGGLYYAGANLPGPIPMPYGDLPTPLPEPLLSYDRLSLYTRYR